MKKQDNRSDHRVQVSRIGSTAKRLAEKSYETRVCRSEYYPSCLADVPGASLNINADQSIREYITIMDEVGMEVQIVSGEIDRGTPRFPSKMIPPHPNVDNELLPRYLEAAHGKGIIILAYYPIIYCKPLKPLHPEWMMKFLDDGRTENHLVEKIEHLIEVGWFTSDLCLTIGMIGTVTGFIMMLSGFTNVDIGDIQTIQDLIKKLGLGMSTALYSTLVGLICSSLLKIQYFNLSQALDRVRDEA